jgi:hypothetical protein
LEGGLKLPVESLENNTVPVGVVGLDETSVTVAVHVVFKLTWIVAGEHCRVVVVVPSRAGPTLRFKLPLLEL